MPKRRRQISDDSDEDRLAEPGLESNIGRPKLPRIQLLANKAIAKRLYRQRKKAEKASKA